MLESVGLVDLDEIAPAGPQYTKVYGLLREALATTNRAGIATFVMRNRQYLAALTTEQETLAVHALHWADEVRDRTASSARPCPTTAARPSRSYGWQCS